MMNQKERNELEEYRNFYEKTQKVIEELQKEMKESENRMKAIDAKDTEKQWNELMIWTTLKHTVSKLLAE